MAHHTITERELNEWLCRPQWQQFAASFGAEANKRFEVDTNDRGECVYRVTDHGETVFLGADKVAAIAAYNEAR
jgi:hypothetical protein